MRGKGAYHLATGIICIIGGLLGTATLHGLSGSLLVGLGVVLFLWGAWIRWTRGPGA